MSRRCIAGGFLLAFWLQFAAPSPAQESPAPVTTAATVSERAFPYKSLPLEMWVEREGQRLPVHRVPELRQGDLLIVKVDLDAPELSSQNSEEQSRLRDWSVGWFLATPEGSLVYDSNRRGKADRGRIDLTRGEREIRIKVENDRQKFPILLFVRTRTLESWEEIQRTRKIKASNFVDHFGRYSDVVAGYENLQAFLAALHREKPQAETLEDRLEAGFQELGFTVDSKMRLGDPQVVAKLLGELENSMGKQSNTFKAEAAGKMISQMLGDQDLGLIGAAASIGGFFYRATDYQESYHWSSARLEPVGEGRFWVKSSERVRYGEDEQAPDGTSRQNVRSILVCTPMAASAPNKPSFAWKSDEPGSLVPSSNAESSEVRVVGDLIKTRSHPALVEPTVIPQVQVWDSRYGEDSPLRASLKSSGALEIQGFEKLWRGEKKVEQAEVKVTGHWGFEPVTIAQFKALASVPEDSVTLLNAPYLLSQSQHYWVELQTPKPISLGVAKFAGRPVKIEEGAGGRIQLTLEPSRAESGLARLEVYAGQDTAAHQRVFSREFWIVSGSKFHAVWPQGSKSLQLISDKVELDKVLLGVAEVRVGESVFARRNSESKLFDLTTENSATEKDPLEVKAELRFAEASRGAVPNVHVERPGPPAEVAFELYPRTGSTSGLPFAIELPPESQFLALGSPTEFRLRASSAWAGQTRLNLDLVGPNGQKQSQVYSSRPQSGERVLREKGVLLFGDFTPQATGKLLCQLTSPVPDSELTLNWALPTDWTVVDLPKIRSVESSEGRVVLKGEDLDVTLSGIYAEPEGDGAPLSRRPDGDYEVQLSGLDPSEFWISLSDDPISRRLRVSRTGR